MCEKKNAARDKSDQKKKKKTKDALGCCPHGQEVSQLCSVSVSVCRRVYPDSCSTPPSSHDFPSEVKVKMFLKSTG